MDAQGNAYKLLGILQSYAPTGKEQQLCSDVVAAMEKDGFSENGLVLGLTGYIRDGLLWGSWPWKKHNAEVISE